MSEKVSGHYSIALADEGYRKNDSSTNLSRTRHWERTRTRPVNEKGAIVIVLLLFASVAGFDPQFISPLTIVSIFPGCCTLGCERNGAIVTTHASGVIE